MSTARIRAAIGRVQLGLVPRVVLCLTDSNGGRLPKGCTPDLIEARIDLFRKQTPEHVENVLREIRRAGHPIIATIRTAAEGGRWRASDRAREQLFHVAIPLVDAVDVELRKRRVAKRIIKAAHAGGRVTIVSTHDFHGTPSAAILARRIRDAVGLGADIVKLATLARDRWDVARLLQVLLSHPRVPLVALAMGPEGRLSRVFFPAAGSLLTYAFAEGKSVVAPGQLPLRALQAELARYYPRSARASRRPPAEALRHSRRRRCF